MSGALLHCVCVRACACTCAHVPIDAHSLIYDWLNAAAHVAVNNWQAISKGWTTVAWRNPLQTRARGRTQEPP